MSIIESTYIEGEVQSDGRRYVIERHVSSDGQVFSYEWLGSQEAQPVLSLRQDTLNKMLESKKQAEAVVFGTSIPLTVYEFLSRMTPEERISIRTAAKTDPVIEDFMDFLNRSGVVYMTNPNVQAGLSYLVSAGKLTQTRATVIGSPL